MAFTHILIPTDFSEPANRALHYALEEATFHHAKVTLLHVLRHGDRRLYAAMSDEVPAEPLQTDRQVALRL